MPKKTFGEAKRAGAHLFTCVKRNQKTLHEEITDSFGYFTPRVHDAGLFLERGLIIRKVVRELPANERTLPSCDAWRPLLRSLVMIERTDQASGAVERQIWVCSKRVNAKRAFTLIQSHWHVENKAHLALDRSLREDLTPACRGASALARGRGQILNRLRKKTVPGISSLRGKQVFAAASPENAKFFMK